LNEVVMFASNHSLSHSHLQVAHQFAALSKETPLFDSVGLMPSSDRPSNTVCSYTSVHDELAAKAKSYAQKYQQFVLEYAVEWEKIIRTRIDNGIKKAEELRIELDHYQKKTETLRLSANQSMVKGKSVPSSIQEKLTRNEEKLIASKQSYNQVATDLCILMEEVTERSWRDLHPLLVKVAQFDMTVANDDAKSLAPLAQVVSSLKQVATENGLSAQPRLKDLASLKPELLSTRPGGVAALQIEAGPVFGTAANAFDSMALPPGSVGPQGMGGFPVQIPSLSTMDPYASRSGSVTSFNSAPAPATGFNGGDMPNLSMLSIQPAPAPTMDDIYSSSNGYPSSTRSAPTSGNFNALPPLGPSMAISPSASVSSNQWNVRSSSFNDVDSAYSGFSMPPGPPPPPPSMPPPPPPGPPSYGASNSSYNSMVPLPTAAAPSPWANPAYSQPMAPPPMAPMSMYAQPPVAPPQSNPNYNPFGY
jgi:hypothetical protein